MKIRIIAVIIAILIFFTGCSSSTAEDNSKTENSSQTTSSSQKTDEDYYQEAIQLFDQGKYKEAQKEFSKLSGYKESSDYERNCKLIRLARYYYAYCIDYMSGILKNPSSLQVHEVKIEKQKVGQNFFWIKIDYSAQNGFGGMNREEEWYEAEMEEGELSNHWYPDYIPYSENNKWFLDNMDYIDNYWKYLKDIDYLSTSFDVSDYEYNE